MSTHAVVHTPVGGPILARPFRWLLLVAGIGVVTIGFCGGGLSAG